MSRYQPGRRSGFDPALASDGSRGRARAVSAVYSTRSPTNSPRRSRRRRPGRSRSPQASGSGRSSTSGSAGSPTGEKLRFGGPTAPTRTDHLAPTRFPQSTAFSAILSLHTPVRFPSSHPQACTLSCWISNAHFGLQADSVRGFDECPLDRRNSGFVPSAACTPACDVIEPRRDRDEHRSVRGWWRDQHGAAVQSRRAHPRGGPQSGSRAPSTRQWSMPTGTWAEIVEAGQAGKVRAGHGDEIIEQLSARLSAAYGRGFSIRNLWSMRQFFLTFPHGSAAARIPQTALQNLAASRVRPRRDLSGSRPSRSPPPYPPRPTRSREARWSVASRRDRCFPQSWRGRTTSC